MVTTNRSAFSMSLWLSRKMKKLAKVQRLQKANVTRWTSVRCALKTFRDAKDAIIALLGENEHRRSSSRKDVIISAKVKLEDITLTADEWDCIDEVVTSLEMATEAAVELQGEKYVTLSQVVPIIGGVRASVEPGLYSRLKKRVK